MPKGALFYAPLAGITPGEVALLEVAPVPGSPVKMSTGVLVIYADRESFTCMTPEGHALSPWITFSADRDGDCVERRRQWHYVRNLRHSAAVNKAEGTVTAPARWLRRRRAAG